MNIVQEIRSWLFPIVFVISIGLFYWQYTKDIAEEKEINNRTTDAMLSFQKNVIDQHKEFHKDQIELSEILIDHMNEMAKNGFSNLDAIKMELDIKSCTDAKLDKLETKLKGCMDKKIEAAKLGIKQEHDH